MKIIHLVGARPQFIKLFPLLKEINGLVVHTGQHYDDNMSKVFFDEMEIKEPDYNLGIGSGLHGEQTGKMVIEFERVCIKEKPDIILVFGDTNSTLAGALTGAKLNILVAHVEAGLRSYDKTMPEEINRILCDHCSDILFCPTETAVENLRKEGITKNVYNVGDIMYDACLHFLKIAEKKSKIIEELNLKANNYFLVTLHRPVNVDDENNLKIILDSFDKLDKKVVFPLHPRTRKMINEFKIDIGENIKIIEPVGYLDMLMLEKNAKSILTDSGGVQKEAYFFKKPCITLRESTEWVETIGNGNILCKINKNEIIKKVNDMSTRKFSFDKNFYGDGNSAKRIKEVIEKWTLH